MLFFLRKAWAWVKKHWRLLVLFLAVLVGAVLLRKRAALWIEGIRQINTAHEEELEAIDRARQEERRLREESDARLKATLAQVEEEYAAQHRELGSRKRKEIEKILKEDGDDPLRLAERLAEATGLRVVLPEE